MNLDERALEARLGRFFGLAVIAALALLVIGLVLQPVLWAGLAVLAATPLLAALATAAAARAENDRPLVGSVAAAACGLALAIAVGLYLAGSR